jgi:hypothetical protein
MLKSKYFQVIIAIVFILATVGCQSGENQNTGMIDSASENSIYQSASPTMASQAVTSQPTSAYDVLFGNSHEVTKSTMYTPSADYAANSVSKKSTSRLISPKPSVNKSITKKGTLPKDKTVIVTSTPQPSKSTPDIAIPAKTPIVSCDGDVCRIITVE